MRNCRPISCSTAKFSRGPRAPPLPAAFCASTGVAFAAMQAPATEAIADTTARLVVLTPDIPSRAEQRAGNSNSAGLFPPARAQPLVERRKGLVRRRHQPAETLF